jgi:hypothetical protein
MIIQTSIHVPESVNLDTEDFLKAFERWLSISGDLTVDEFEIIQDDEDSD